MGFVKLQLVAKSEKKIEGFQKVLKLRFLNSDTVPRNVKGWTLWDFRHPLCCKISKQTKGRPFGGIQKISKSRIVPKEIQGKTPNGGFYVFEVLDVDVFVLDDVLAFRVRFGRP